MRTKAPWVLLFSILVINAAPADDRLRQHQDSLSIRSDTVLSGIEFYHNTVPEVIAKLGKPIAIKTLRTLTEGAVTLIERSYEWQREECQLRIVVEESDGKNTVNSIEVWGTRPCGEVGTTGRGLKLGDSISDVRRIYNLRQYFGVTLPQERQPAWIASGCVIDTRAVLGVGFDDEGRINHMRMDPSREVCF